MTTERTEAQPAAQINAANHSAAGVAESQAPAPSEPGDGGVAPTRSAPSAAPHSEPQVPGSSASTGDGAPGTTPARSEPDPFNCPKCGAHDFGLNRPRCPHCEYESPPTQEPAKNGTTEKSGVLSPALGGDLAALVGKLRRLGYYSTEQAADTIERLVREREETMTQIPQLLRDATRRMQQRAEAAERDAARLREAEVLETYSGTDGKRQWAHHAETWLYPGDKVMVVNDEATKK